ncbi:MAG: tRNA (adenosine(37)-N6)-dimethylallyltransferase MiaA [Clostridia bacterium]|nr:tRNA (adenosine(37)-N6)-dimethylallyltransferase MiaA [Clostridia bacterium]
MKDTKVIVILGPTASGKTGLGIRLAKSLNGEIISGDSMQVYRGMDIGTAKPTHAETEGIPHHLIDILDIKEKFSVADFCLLATEAVRDISSRGKTPIIVGGTGMYIETLVSGRLYETESADEEKRREYEAYARENGADALHAILRDLDPVSAEKIHPNNVKRVIRAIEIASSGDKTKSRLEETNLAEKPFRSLMLYLTPPSREVMYERINRRVDIMMEEGLLDEVKSLDKMGLRETPTASQAIGYKEFFPYLDGECTLEESVEKLKQHTRNYAKRQTTYFGHMTELIFVSADENGGDTAQRICEQWLKTL